MESRSPIVPIPPECLVLQDARVLRLQDFITGKNLCKLPDPEAHSIMGQSLMNRMEEPQYLLHLGGVLFHLHVEFFLELKLRSVFSLPIAVTTYSNQVGITGSVWREGEQGQRELRAHLHLGSGKERWTLPTCYLFEKSSNPG